MYWLRDDRESIGGRRARASAAPQTIITRTARGHAGRQPRLLATLLLLLAGS